MIDNAYVCDMIEDIIKDTDCLNLASTLPQEYDGVIGLLCEDLTMKMSVEQIARCIKREFKQEHRMLFKKVSQETVTDTAVKIKEVFDDVALN